MLLELQLGSFKVFVDGGSSCVEHHIMTKPSTSSGLTTCSHFTLLFPHISGLIFFQCSAFGPNSDDPIDSIFPLKEADSVCVLLFFCFTERLQPVSLEIADNVSLYKHVMLIV